MDVGSTVLTAGVCDTTDPHCPHLAPSLQVSAALKEGRPVEPEFYPCVTVFFSDIVNFTHISSVLAPREVGISARSQGWTCHLQLC